MFVLILTATLFSQATPPASGSPIATPKPAEARMVCRRERVVGTLRPVRTCRSQAEWDQIRDAAKDIVESFNRQDKHEKLDHVHDRGPVT